MKSAAQEPSASSPIAQAMETRFNGLSLGILSYLQNHDSASLDRIQFEGDEAKRLLDQLKQKMSQEGNGAYAQVEKAYKDVQAATLDLLSIDHNQAKSRTALNASNEELMSILISRIEPSIQSNQLNSAARFQAALAAAAEAKNVTRSPDRAGLAARQADALGASQNRFNKAVDLYAALSRTRRAKRWAQEAKTLFDQCVTQAAELQEADEKTQAAFARYTQKRNAFDGVLHESLLTGIQVNSVDSLKELFSSGLILPLGSALLIVAGILLVIGSWPRTERNVIQPLPIQNIIQCAEAAASGDVSRIPQEEGSEELGRLAQAVGRLITVLARSENLVYHLAALVESSGDAIISQTLEGTVLSWNKSAQRIYGYSAEEMKGRSIAMLSPYDGGAEMMQNLRKVRRGERIAPFETLHQASNGRTIRAFVRISPILDSTRQVIGASFCAQDLTDTELLQSKSIDGKRLA